MPVVSYLPAEILDYIATHAPAEDSVFGISQRELAKALGYHPSSMCRPLQDLVESGHLNTRRAVVRGGVRKQFVYTLTEEGRTHLRKRTKDVPLLSGELPPPPNPFVGRREELKELWTYSKEGGAVIFVEGPPGMGKTALISRHIRRLKAGRVPFWFKVRPSSSARHFTVALSHALAATGAQQLAYYSQLPRQPVGREVADLAHRALADREFLAVIDDSQEASQEMRQFLGEFVGGLGHGRRDLIFVLGQGAPILDPVNFSVHHMMLGGLDRVAAHELTDRRGGLADRFEGVYQASLGSPLFLQLAVATPDAEVSPTALPAAIVNRLDPKEIDALLPIALANEPLPASFIEEVSGITEARINQLAQGGVLQHTFEGRVELLQVVRTALMTKVGPVQERAGHATLATFYSRSHSPEAVRERFLHLVASENWKLSSQVLENQEKTLLSLGYSDHLRNALRHLTLAMPKAPERGKALRVEAAVLRMHSEYTEAIQSLRRSITEGDSDPRLEGESLMLIVELYVRLRQVDEANRTLDEA
ncbi:MAG: AAA family ATPase, partial [Thermoplasmata archaeon]|nr:AAA family ATPase [Thermoplasmata archaeon]